MKIAIGIMLWNEEGTIGMTIDSIFAQTLLCEPKDGVESVEVVVVANGCSDQSVPRAQTALMRNLQCCPVRYVTGRVEDLSTPSKSNAWNRYVHDLAAPDTSYMFMLDADVVIQGPDTMWKMLDGLDHHPRQYVAAALGVKDIEAQPRKTAWQRMALAMTNLERQARFMYLCGGLYCGRASFFRNWRFPDGWICGDDAWLGTMAITNFLTTDYEFDRILYPDGASFVFEAYTSIPKLFRQHRRRQVGAAVRRMVADYVRERQINGTPDAGEIVRRACSENPQWLRQYVESRIQGAGFWVIPAKGVFYRFGQLRTQRLAMKLVKAPLVLVGTFWAAAVIVAANRMFRKRTFERAWQNNPNARLVKMAATAR